MAPKAQIEKFLRRDDRGRGKGKDATDYWFRVKGSLTGLLLDVPVAISRTAQATRVDSIDRQPTEEDFIAIARLRLEERIREGFVPTQGMTLDDHDEVLSVSSDVLPDIARRALRKG